MASLIQKLDDQLAELLEGWNTTSTLLVLAIVGYLVYAAVSSQDPDTHPMLLQRQSVPSNVRKPGESAILRHPEVPHGFPLRSGLNVKEKDAPSYAPGKDGDLRDVWRRVTGEIAAPETRGYGAPPTTGEQGKIMTVFGKEDIQEHSVSEITKEIVIIGNCVKKQGATRVAIYLPNSIEFLVALFACSYYGLTAILIPFNQSPNEVLSELAATKADALIAEAGSVALEDAVEAYKGLKQVIWVVEKTSRHMDWTEVPKDVGGQMDVSMWHQLIQDHQDVSSTSIPTIKSEDLPGVVTLWMDKSGKPSYIVEFSQANLVAAISSLQTSIPLRQRLNPSDLFLSADSWTSTYALCWTLAALFSQSSIAINSVAGPNVNLAMCMRRIAPTVVVASAETAEKLHADSSAEVTGGLKRLAHSTQIGALEAGRMPTDSIMTSLNAPHRAAIGTTPGKLRLLLVSERAGAESPPLSTYDLSDLRVFTGARVLYALTAPKVAGAVAQTTMYDYRRSNGAKNKHSHFGAPLSSLEVKMVDSATHKTTDDEARGEVVVTGPSVAGGQANLGFAAKCNDDFTIAYA